MLNFANCSEFSEGQLDALVALRGGTSAIACVALVAFLIVICTCRSKFGLDKDEKWLRVSLFALFGVSICYLAVLSFSVLYHLLPPANAGTWCAIFGCFGQILSVLQVTLLFVNTGPILMTLCSDMSGQRESYRRNANRAVKLLMVATVAFAVLIMIVSAIIPFVTRTYGEYGGWCWIHSRDKNCKQSITGFLEQIFLWVAFHVFISLVCVIITLMAVMLLLKKCWKVKKLSESSKTLPEIKKICRKYTFQVVILIPLFLDVAHFASKSHVHRYDFTLWVVYALASPIIGFFIPFSFFLYIKYGEKYNDGCRDNSENVQTMQCTPSTEYLTPDHVPLVPEVKCKKEEKQNLLRPKDNSSFAMISYSSSVYGTPEASASFAHANVVEEDKQPLPNSPQNKQCNIC